jgi:hypothetical protein
LLTGKSLRFEATDADQSDSRYLPADEPIDLLNVAFENPRAIANAQRERAERERVATRRKLKGKGKAELPEAEGDIASPYDVPDRVTGRETVTELRKLHPEREWRFVEVDVTYQVGAESLRQGEYLLAFVGVPSNTAEGTRLDVSLGHRYVTCTWQSLSDSAALLRNGSSEYIERRKSDADRFRVSPCHFGSPPEGVDS